MWPSYVLRQRLLIMHVLPALPYAPYFAIEHRAPCLQNTGKESKRLCFALWRACILLAELRGPCSVLVNGCCPSTVELTGWDLALVSGATVGS